MEQCLGCILVQHHMECQGNTECQGMEPLDTQDSQLTPQQEEPIPGLLVVIPQELSHHHKQDMDPHHQGATQEAHQDIHNHLLKLTLDNNNHTQANLPQPVSTLELANILLLIQLQPLPAPQVLEDLHHLLVEPHPLGMEHHRARQLL